MLLRPVILACAAVTLLACGRTEPHAPRDQDEFDADAAIASADTRDASTSDAGAGDAGRPDSSLTDAGADAGDAGPDAGCTTRSALHREARPIAAVRHLGGAPGHVRATERLAVDVKLASDCEDLAGVDVSVMPGGATDFVSLSASVWIRVGGPCAPTARTATRVVALPGWQTDNMRMVVADANSPGGGIRLEIGRAPCGTSPDCNCFGPVPGTGTEGSACLSDCSCAAGLSCVAIQRSGGPRLECRAICSDDHDCAATQRCSMKEGGDSPYLCLAAPAGCDGLGACPEGFRCEPAGASRTCRDERVWTNRSCVCEAECGAAEKCFDEWSAPPTCALPCVGDAGCPAGMACGAAHVCVRN